MDVDVVKHMGKTSGAGGDENDDDDGHLITRLAPHDVNVQGKYRVSPGGSAFGSNRLAMGLFCGDLQKTLKKKKPRRIEGVSYSRYTFKPIERVLNFAVRTSWLFRLIANSNTCGHNWQSVNEAFKNWIYSV